MEKNQKHEFLFKMDIKPYDAERKVYPEPTISYLQCIHCAGQVRWWKSPEDTKVERPIKDNIYCNETYRTVGEREGDES